MARPRIAVTFGLVIALAGSSGTARANHRLECFLSASVALRDGGQIRIAWRSRSGALLTSRSVAVSVP